MFGILKKKLSGTIKAISERIAKKEEMIEKATEEVKERPEEIEKIAEEVPEIKPAVEEVKKIVEEVAEKKPEVKEIEEAKEKPKPLFRKVVEKVIKKVVKKELAEADLDPVLDELGNGLMDADVAYEVTEKIKEDLRKSLVGKEIKRGEEGKVVASAIKESLLGILTVPEISLHDVIEKTKKGGRPAVFIFLGFNGVGKSLSLSKTAKWLKNRKYKPLLAAGDTFRAAGIHQLEEYGKKVGVPVIKQTYGSDACAVIFDARKAAEARGFDVVLADTAGRSHVDTNLMAELQKICRVNKPDLKILVLDSLSGSDVLAQFEFFDKAVGVDAVVFSKVDVNEKGGNMLSVCYKFKRPILFLGMGQGYGQLEAYSPERFISQLLPS